MKRIEFKDIYELVDYALQFDDDEIAIVAKYDVVREIAFYMISGYGIELNSIEFHPDINDEYLVQWDEYGLYINYIKPNRTNCYINFEDGETVFVHSDINSKFVLANKDNDCELVEFDFIDDWCDRDCEHCKWHNSEEENVPTNEVAMNESNSGITISWNDGNSYFSQSFYSSDKDEVERKRAEWRRFAQMF